MPEFQRPRYSEKAIGETPPFRNPSPPHSDLTLTLTHFRIVRVQLEVGISAPQIAVFNFGKAAFLGEGRNSDDLEWGGGVGIRWKNTKDRVGADRLEKYQETGLGLQRRCSSAVEGKQTGGGTQGSGLGRSDRHKTGSGSWGAKENWHHKYPGHT